MKRSVPKIVTYRQRLVLTAHVGIALVICAAVLSLTSTGFAFVCWMIGDLVAVTAIFLLRRSVHHQDRRPEQDLDEYELQRRNKALRGALGTCICFIMLALLAFSVVPLVRLSGDDPRSALNSVVRALQACSYMTFAAILYIPLQILQGIAGGMNKDLLVSVEHREEVPAS